MSVTRPRGRLPQRVYWVRRLLVLGLAFALVFGIGRLLDGGPGGSDGPSAQPASGMVSDRSLPATLSTADASPKRASVRGRNAEPRRTRTPLATPSGPCADADVRAVPVLVDTARAGGEVGFTLELTTFDSPACTWQVAPGSLAVRITSGDDRIWSSQDCPGAVPEQQVVLRDKTVATVRVTWSGRRSDSGCTRTTQWAEPGYYHLSAAALGSEPADLQFELRSPAPVTITPTPTPKGRGRGGQT